MLLMPTGGLPVMMIIHGVPTITIIRSYGYGNTDDKSTTMVQKWKIEKMGKESVKCYIYIYLD